MKNLIFIIIFILILAGVIIFIFSQDTIEEPTVSPTPPVLTPRPTSSVLLPTSTLTSPVLSPTPATSKVSVTYLDSGYSPAIVTVKKGDTVYFENKSSKMMWTASAGHPIHSVYPGSNIEMCGTNTLIAIFDACRGYSFGELWEFIFIHQGTWKYHNHLQSNHTGTVVVE